MVRARVGNILCYFHQLVLALIYCATTPSTCPEFKRVCMGTNLQWKTMYFVDEYLTNSLQRPRIDVFMGPVFSW